MNLNKHLLVNNTFENTLVNTIGTIGDSIIDTHSNTHEKMTKTTKNVKDVRSYNLNSDRTR